jgi:integrase
VLWPVHLQAVLEAAIARDRSSARYGSLGRLAAMLVLALAGLRVGELCALCWADIDFEHGVI